MKKIFGLLALCALILTPQMAVAQAFQPGAPIRDTNPSPTKQPLCWSGAAYVICETLNWRYVAATAGISNTTTAVTVKAAAAAGIRNYVDAIQCSSDALMVDTVLAIRDGAGGTVLLRQRITTAGIPGGFRAEFPVPLKGTAATLLEIVTLTASGTGAVWCNLQGHTGS